MTPISAVKTSHMVLRTLMLLGQFTLESINNSSGGSVVFTRGGGGGGHMDIECLILKEGSLST